MKNLLASALANTRKWSRASLTWLPPTPSTLQNSYLMPLCGTQWPPTVLDLPPPPLVPLLYMGSMTNSLGIPLPVEDVSPPVPLKHGHALARPCILSWNLSLQLLNEETLPILYPGGYTFKNGSPCSVAHLTRPYPEPSLTASISLPRPQPPLLILPPFSQQAR